MADVRAAGSHSGSTCGFMESSKPFSGVVHEMLHRQPPPKQKVTGTMTTGDSHHCEALARASPPNHNAGGIPRHNGRFTQVAIPGYKGHVAGKVCENMHGQTFGAENERATQMMPLRHLRRSISAPDTISASALEGPKGLSNAPRVPGYAGHIPGKHAETVHGHRFSEASAAATSLREANPHISCDGWLRRGQWPADRMATYKWNNRFSRADTQDLFTPEQEMECYEANKRLGQSFGLKPAKKMAHKPGDRFLHSMSRKAPKESDPSASGGFQTSSPQSTLRAATLSPTTAAGRPSISRTMDNERDCAHNTLGLGKAV